MSQPVERAITEVQTGRLRVNTVVSIKPTQVGHGPLTGRRTAPTVRLNLSGPSELILSMSADRRASQAQGLERLVR